MSNSEPKKKTCSRGISAEKKETDWNPSESIASQAAKRRYNASQWKAKSREAKERV